ncbi:MAG: hypothetical protein WD035_04630 [Balneolaceae bacterium]
MKKQHFNESYGLKAPENYERYFVPAIGEPLAKDLVRLADLRSGERVLDVACGTGIVARLASEQVGKTGYLSVSVKKKATSRHDLFLMKRSKLIPLIRLTLFFNL